jgi:hypothetical protein
MKQTEALESSNGIYQKLEAFIRSIIRMNWFEEYFHRFRLVVFSFHAFFWIFSLVEANGKGCFVLDFCRCRSVTAFYCISIFKLLKLQRDWLQWGFNYYQVTLSMSMIVWLIFSNCQIRVRLHSSELLLASIDQNALQPIPFGNAINFKSNSKYLPFAIVPILLILVFYLSGTML